MIASPWRVSPSRSNVVDALSTSLIVGVVGMSLSTAILMAAGAVDIGFKALPWVMAMTVMLVVAQVPTARRGDRSMALVMLTFLAVVSRSWLLSTGVAFSGQEVLGMLLSVPAFLGIAVLGGVWLVPNLRHRRDLLPTIVLCLAAVVGLWSILVYAAVSPSDRTDLEATGRIVAVSSVVLWAIAQLILWTRPRYRRRPEMVILLGCWLYLVGDVVGIYGLRWDITLTLRFVTCGLLGLAALMRVPDVPVHDVERSRDRVTAALIIAGPTFMIGLPLLAWVSRGASNPSWFAPAWVGLSAVMVSCLSVALAVPQRVRARQRRAPHPSRRHLYFQPIVRSTDRVTIGAEALFRLSKGDVVTSGGHVFEELANSPQLARLTDWVLEAVFREGRDLLEQFDDPEAFVSLNLSPEEFAASGLIARIDRTLERLGCTADGFMIEITELAFVRGADPVNELVGLLHDRGFMVALDDFGSGYASLHSIVDVDFDLVKVARSMVVSVDKPRGDHLLGRTIELLASSGLLVVAEGAEDDAQLGRVLEKRPHFVQGFATGPPMPVADFIEHLNSSDSGGTIDLDIADSDVKPLVRLRSTLSADAEG